MTNTDRYRNLLIKYLLDELDTEKQSQVKRWIEQSADNQLYYEELKKTVDLTDLHQMAGKIQVDRAWSDFQRALGTIDKDDYVDAESADLTSVDLYERDMSRRQRNRRIVVAWSVAATLLLAFGLWSLWPANRIETATAVISQDSLNKKRVAELRHEINETTTIKRIQMEDGTVVLMEQKSEISFLQPFEDNIRKVTLSGKAVFEVSHDKDRPFVVRSGTISTTVLGTRFQVSAYPADSYIYVQLFEGRIVIQDKDADEPLLKQDFFLMPGQQFVYNKKTGTGKVGRSDGRQTGARNRNSIDDADDPSIPTSGKTSWYMFNNQPLSEVLDQLKAIYGVNIIYNMDEIKNIYFIGKFNKSDSVDQILKHICSINTLQLAVREKTYVIHK